MKQINAIITVEYKGNQYISSEIELEDGSAETIMINTISTTGTDKLSYFKMPLNCDKFIVFSRMQLDECVFMIELKDRVTKKVRKIDKK